MPARANKCGRNAVRRGIRNKSLRKLFGYSFLYSCHSNFLSIPFVKSFYTNLQNNPE